MSSTIPDKYSFFKTFKVYSLFEVQMEKDYIDQKVNNTCNSFPPDVRISDNESANHICDKFLHLFNLIISKKSRSGNNSLDNNDFSYLNYWFNRKLRYNKPSHKLTVKDFYENMSDQEVEFVTGTFKGKLYDLENEDFNNMIILSLLQEQYVENFEKFSILQGKEDISCLEHLQKLIDTYKQGIIKCPLNNSDFCRALYHFKGDYENLFVREDGLSEKCIDRERLQLPTYNDVLLEHKNNTIAGTILGPSFGTLFTMIFMYKFTPLGRWIQSKVVTNKEVHNDIYAESEQSLLSASDNDYINSDFNEYNISYNSVTNS
ncbi:PIR protein [Plasmodium ovale]|uniref:PIR protein n=1 Tax=Plasmodium ovale TaxID=36330 RepID=A0A1D3JBG8_PLAOA|nr:PIR protein [Plasmodium ovale]